MTETSKHAPPRHLAQGHLEQLWLSLEILSPKKLCGKLVSSVARSAYLSLLPERRLLPLFQDFTGA